MKKLFAAVICLLLSGATAIAEGGGDKARLLYQGHGSLRITTAEDKIIYKWCADVLHKRPGGCHHAVCAGRKSVSRQDKARAQKDVLNVGNMGPETPNRAADPRSAGFARFTK